MIIRKWGRGWGWGGGAAGIIPWISRLLCYDKISWKAKEPHSPADLIFPGSFHILHCIISVKYGMNMENVIQWHLTAYCTGELLVIRDHLTSRYIKLLTGCNIHQCTSYVWIDAYGNVTLKSTQIEAHSTTFQYKWPILFLLSCKAGWNHLWCIFRHGFCLNRYDVSCIAIVIWNNWDNVYAFACVHACTPLPHAYTQHCKS